jgi:hypothetical protein
MKKKFIFQNRQAALLDDMDEVVETSCTVLIPQEYWEELHLKIENYGSMKNYFSYLLKKYEIYLKSGIVPYSTSLKTEYQAKGQNLIRKDFEPWKKDWFVMKLYRAAFNFSMNKLFVLLLRLDLMDFAEVVNSSVNLDIPVATGKKRVFQYGGFHQSESDWFTDDKKAQRYERVYQFG